MKVLRDVISHSSLQSYIAQHDLLTPLKTVFNNLLPEWAQQCEVGNYDNGLLTLIVPHASWATRIRYETPALIAQLKDSPQFATLHSIKCRIIPAQSPPVNRPIKHLPQFVCQLLQQTAESIQHAPLKTALLQLASRFKDTENSQQT